MKWFINLFKNKGEELIAEYWHKDVERKKLESRITKYPSSHYSTESEKLKKEIKKLGGTNLMIIAEKLEAPRIRFTLNDKEIISDEIFDFTYDKIIKNIKLKI